MAEANIRAIKKIAILGTGTMGAGLAAHAASCGYDVLLLDLPAGDGERNAIAARAKAAMSEGRAPMLDDPSHGERIEIGNFEDDMARLSECQLIVEAIIEDLAIKRDMFEKIEAVRAEGSIVTSNTSGIMLAKITAGLPEGLRREVGIIHFFNPVKVMKLVELIAGAETEPEVMHTLEDFLANRLGKGVVFAKDTVNFIANRIGCYWLLAGVNEAPLALSDGLSMEELDAALGAPVGVPATALYGLLDLIGLDIMGLVAINLKQNLAADDAGRKVGKFPANVEAMLERGQIGRKAGGGFYRMQKTEDGGRLKEIFDLNTGQWRHAETVILAENHQDLAGLMSSDDSLGKFVRGVMGATLNYAADLVPEISDDIVNIDRAMRWGFGWRQGPFQMLDQLGPESVITRLEGLGTPLPKMLQVLKDSGAKTFYRNDGTEFLTADGTWDSVSQ